MELPGSYYLECPVCGKETLHKILKGEVGTKGEEVTIDGVIQCNECGNTRHKTIRENSAIDVPVIVSWQDSSYKEQLSLYPEEWVHKGDDLLIDGKRVKVTSLEGEGNRRKNSAKAEDIVTIWTREHEKELVKVSIHKGRSSTSKTLEAAPEEEFFIGDMLDVGKYKTVIHRINTKDGTIKRGKAKAEDITRIYTKTIR